MKVGNIRSLKFAVKLGFTMFKYGLNPVLIGAVYLGIIKGHTFNLKEIGKFKFSKIDIGFLIVYIKLLNAKVDFKIIKNIFLQLNDDVIDLGIVKIYNKGRYSVPFLYSFVDKFILNELMVDNVGGE